MKLVSTRWLATTQLFKFWWCMLCDSEAARLAGLMYFQRMCTAIAKDENFPGPR